MFAGIRIPDTAPVTELVGPPSCPIVPIPDPVVPVTPVGPVLGPAGPVTPAAPVGGTEVSVATVCAPATDATSRGLIATVTVTGVDPP